MEGDKLIKISEMASLHGVTRQTLILYDKNGLLKPMRVAENGYRYYSVDQIPRLRQICLLKEMGVPLAEIRLHLDAPTTEGMRALMADRRRAISAERDRLDEQLREIDQLDQIFTSVTTKEKNVGIPHVLWLPSREAIFAPFPEGEMNPRQLHLTLMDAWGRMLESGVIPSCGFGALLDAGAVATNTPLAGAGSMVVVPPGASLLDIDTVTLPAGEYVCMYKYSMPYVVDPLRELLAWMTARGLEPAGLVVDRCLLDSVFYGEGRNSDFCRLEVLLG